MNLYTIIFEDGTNFEGGTLQQPKWLELPNKKIHSIFYSLPLGDYLFLSGYDAYYHLIEICQDINGDRSGEIQLEYSYFIGKKEKDYKVYKISLRTGQIEIQNLTIEDKFIKQLNPMGWK